MAELLQKNDFNDEDLILPQEPDLLGVLSSTQDVVEQGEYVWIVTGRLELLVDQWLQKATDHNAKTTPTWYDRYHFYDGTERTANWILALDAMNFCFWAEKDQPRWCIEYQGERLNGYFAEAAALKRAVEEGFPLWDASYLSTISEKDLAYIFRGEQTIPLFEERLRNLREVGTVLLQQYDGQCIHAIELADRSAVKLALLLAKDFLSFNDVALYRNRTIRFFKRAQICVADLHGSFSGKSWGAFSDIDQLTAFADYKLPQVLRHFGVLEYLPSLARRIDAQELLEAGSEEEVELRAATIWACELLRQELARHKRIMTTAEIDLRLWLLGQNSSTMQPYHRTRTIYY
jgi:Potential Queuosine, Q, salvage protein family